MKNGTCICLTKYDYMHFVYKSNFCTFNFFGGNFRHTAHLTEQDYVPPTNQQTYASSGI